MAAPPPPGTERGWGTIFSRLAEALLFFFFGFVACHQVHAATPEEIKAAYLYQFLKYVEWPAKNAPQTEVVICLLDASGVYRILNQKAGTVVEGKRIVVKQASRPEGVGTAHLLFVGESYSDVEKIIKTFNPRGVLTVGESSGFAKKGGMIGFVIPEDTVQFEINWGEAKAQGITISSKLLQLATIVSTE